MLDCILSAAARYRNHVDKGTRDVDLVSCLQAGELNASPTFPCRGLEKRTHL
jgi:hypothetical protein